MSSLRNKINIGIGSIEIFNTASKFHDLKLNYKTYFRKEKFSYTPWVLCDEIFVSRNSNITSDNLIKYEYINSFTKVKNNVPIDIINQYNVYKRKMIRVVEHKEKIMKKVA